jgi:hypothetical protein
MRHDPACEWDAASNSPHCRCAERAYLADASPDEVAAFKARRGYDTNFQTQWDLPRREA